MNHEPDDTDDGDGTPASERRSARVHLSVATPRDVEPGELEKIRLALAHGARRMTAAGQPVDFVHCMYLPGRDCLLCVFTAENEEPVHAAVRLTGLPFTPINAEEFATAASSA